MPADRAERAFLAFQTELARERAAALGRAGRRLEEHLEECRRLAASLRAGGDGVPAPEVRRRYRAARAAAEEARWALCVQREALGLADHRWVDRIYPLPPPL